MIDINKFPFSSIRKQQKQLIDMLNKNDNKKYFILEMPTGFGKSAIAINLCNSEKNGFIITATKQLQDQYIKDFYKNQNIISIKGKANYRCAIDNKLNCEIGPCIVDKKQAYECKKKYLCPYYNQRQSAIESQIFLTSYQYFFRAIECGKWIKERDILVFDECHLFENQMVEWAEMKLSFKELCEKYKLQLEATDEEYFNFALIPTDNGYKQNERWLKTVFNLINKRRTSLFDEIKIKLKITGNIDTLSENDYLTIIDTHKDYYFLDKIYKKLDIFFQHNNYKDWIIEPYEDGLILTPIKINNLFKYYIDKMGIKKIVFMSGTILDVKGFKEILGIEDNETFSCRFNSNFNPKNSPIIYNPICKMNYENLNDNLSIIKDEIEKILLQHSKEKGIIHTGNLVVSKYLKEHLISDRLLIRYGDIENNTIIKLHNASNKPTVLVSSSLSEGVDLKDDLSRFQIIVKLPWVSIKNTRVSEKIKINDDWYVAEMFKSLIQQCGRSTRNNTDYSTTYIFDIGFKYWFLKYRRKGWFSKYFIERINFNNK